MDLLRTQHLHLIPLSLSQLSTGLQSIRMLSINLGIPLANALFEGVVERAVRMKIEKMQSAPEYMHPWYTYWLIVILDENIGAGLVGFKGIPDQSGSVEIGYGIGELFRQKGYMTEAVKAMVEWAFSHPECQTITATGVLPTNVASQKVLIKSGFTEISGGPDGVHFKLERALT